MLAGNPSFLMWLDSKFFFFQGNWKVKQIKKPKSTFNYVCETIKSYIFYDTIWFPINQMKMKLNNWPNKSEKEQN